MKQRNNFTSEIFLFGAMTFAFMYFIFLGMELYTEVGQEVGELATANLSLKRKLALLFLVLCTTGFLASEYVRTRSRGE